MNLTKRKCEGLKIAPCKAAELVGFAKLNPVCHMNNFSGQFSQLNIYLFLLPSIRPNFRKTLSNTFFKFIRIFFLNRWYSGSGGCHGYMFRVPCFMRKTAENQDSGWRRSLHAVFPWFSSTLNLRTSTIFWYNQILDKSPPNLSRVKYENY